ncbi:MAG: Uma2 family endonuclease [Planctomycetes bacterium]|nr:Uma2 family endonuclease [Planctomycetota bacterium]
MPTAVKTPPPVKKRATEADLLAMPNDGIERWLVDGQIVEKGRDSEISTVTVRNKHHTRIQSRISHLIEAWCDAQPTPRGSIHAGETGVRLKTDPEVIVGIDLVYLAPDVSARVMADEETTMIGAVPTLAVEILSPSNTVEGIREKIDVYLKAGVPQVLILDGHYRTVTVHRSGQAPVMLNATQELDGGKELHGFRVAVARIFPTPGA